MPEGASPERVAPLGNGLEICYQTFGDPAGDPLLLVMGLGGPMTWWRPELCRMLADAGFFVIRFDNRDVGRSSRVPGPGVAAAGRGGVLRAGPAAAVHARRHGR